MIPLIEELLKKVIGRRKHGFVFIAKDGGPISDLRARLSIAIRRGLHQQSGGHY